MEIKELLEYNIFKIGKYSLTVYKVLIALIFMGVGALSIYISKILIYKSPRLDLGKKFAFSQILKYVIITLIFFLIMDNLGINVSPLLLGSGAILVGLGLGLQNLFLDFISGIIILLDRSIKVGDVIELEGVTGMVREINMRTTVIETRDKKNMIFPNALLTKNNFTNYSHYDDIVMFNIEVGVNYNTDIHLAKKIMLEVVRKKDSILDSPEPFVRLEDFADSSLTLKLFYFSRELFRQLSIQSDVRIDILEGFRKADIDIPFPIRTLHWDPKHNGPEDQIFQ